MPAEPTPTQAQLLEENGQLKAEVERLKKQNELLRQKVDLLVRKVFGSKSEKMDEAQLLFLLSGGAEPPKVEEPVGVEAPRRSTVQSPPRKSGPRIPEHLAVVEEVIDPEAVKAAPEQWRRIGEEVSERLDYEPARFLKRCTVRPKYVKRAEVDAVPVIAKLPPTVLEGSILTAGLLAQVLVAKYCDHLPLYRQETIYRSRHGVDLPRQLLAQWVDIGAHWLTLIYREIHSEVMGEGYVQIDETPIRYLAPGNGKTKTGYFWAAHRPGGDVVFSWHTSRAASCLEKIVPVDFTGVIQCDGYAAYDAFAREHADRIELSGCLTHVRRKFVEACEQAPRQAVLVLHMMQNLYATEARLRNNRAGPKLRAITRSLESKPVIQRLHRTLMHWKKAARFLPQSLMGKAIEYTLNQWDSLLLYLTDGRLEIDTNLVENAIRPTAIGKKNWLFIGEANAGDRSAIIYTIIESCRRRGIDPYTYLRDVFTRLPSATNQEIKDLTPAAWAKAQRSPSLKRAA